jgi:hypothetical protein
VGSYSLSFYTFSWIYLAGFDGNGFGSDHTRCIRIPSDTSYGIFRRHC